MNNIETLKMALEALELAGGKLCEALHHPKKLQHEIGQPCPAVVKYDKAITALRQAVEQAQQAEPVAYGTWDTMLGKGNRMMMVRLDKGQDGCTVPLYTAPPPRQPWVGLTDEERFKLAFQTGAMTADWLPFMKAVEAKLKAKNL